MLIFHTFEIQRVALGDELQNIHHNFLRTGVKTVNVNLLANLNLMNLFLDQRFDPAYPEKVAAVRSEEYYVNMMIAWYFATALAKQYDAAIPYIEQNRLDRWTHNKAIQKAIESYRVSDEHKAYLKTLKRKA